MFKVLKLLALGAATMLLLAGCGQGQRGAEVSSNPSSNTSTVQPIRVGIQNIPEDYVVQAKNWAAVYGLKESFVPSPNATRSFQQLLSGQVDVIDSGSGPLLSALSKDPNGLLIIGIRHRGGQRDKIVVRKDAPYKSVKDLLGKTIGVPIGSGAGIAWEGYLQLNGWSDSDFRIVNLQPDQDQQALIQNQVDAVVSWEPTPSFLVINGVGRELADFGKVTSDPNFIVTTRRFAQTHPQELVEFLAGTLEMADYISKKPASAAMMAGEVATKQGIKAQAAVFERAFGFMNFDPNISDKDLSDLAPVANYMVKAGQISSVPAYQQAVNRDFLDKAKKLVQQMSNSAGT